MPQRPLSERLGADSFVTDRTPHLRIEDPKLCQGCPLKPCIVVCPAQVYAWDLDHIRIQFENCLELGACRVACDQIGRRALSWEYPRAPKGIAYRLG
jgi:ferredoxin like protein